MELGLCPGIPITLQYLLNEPFDVLHSVLSSGDRLYREKPLHYSVRIAGTLKAYDPKDQTALLEEDANNIISIDTSAVGAFEYRKGSTYLIIADAERHSFPSNIDDRIHLHFLARIIKRVDALDLRLYHRLVKDRFLRTPKTAESHTENVSL